MPRRKTAAEKTREIYQELKQQALFDFCPPTKLLQTLPSDIELIQGRSKELPKSLLSQCLSLLRMNMKDEYDQSGFQLEGAHHPGWDDTVKYNELLHHKAFFIILKRRNILKDLEDPNTSCVEKHQDKNNHGLEEKEKQSRVDEDIIGFVHFRFEKVEDSAILYLWEIQLDTSLQGQGLGLELVNYLKSLAIATSMDGIFCTVQKSNKKGSAFYRRCKFTTNFIAPEYEILQWRSK